MVKIVLNLTFKFKCKVCSLITHARTYIYTCKIVNVCVYVLIYALNNLFNSVGFEFQSPKLKTD